MELLKRMTVSQLKNAIWDCNNGRVAIGGLPVEEYRQELILRGDDGKGYHEEPEIPNRSYYKNAFGKLIAAGVPKWYIRLYLLDELIYWSKVYVYYNPYDVETRDGWYSTNGIALAVDTPADKNRKCFGELKSLGFPTWDEYKTLFEGDEHDSPAGFMDAYDRHQEEWLRERKKESCVNYAD